MIITVSEILCVSGDFNGHIERIQMGMREFMVVEDLEDVTWRVRKFLIYCRRQPSYFKFTSQENGESSGNISI